MPMAPKTDAEKAAKLREKAKDKSLPQPVRNQYLDDANKLEEKAAKKAGVNLAKGGAVPKKMAVGGMAEMMQKAQRELGQGATSNAVRSAMEAYKSNLKKQPAAQAATGMKPAATMTKASPDRVAAPRPTGRPGRSAATPMMSRAKQKTVAASNMRMAQQGGTPQQAMPPDFMTKRTAFAGPASAAGGTPQPAMTRQQATAGPAQPKMAKGGAVVAKAPKKMMYGGAVAKDLPKRGSRTATNMAKGGSVAKKAKGK